jgi:hypothetical protein
VADVLEWFITHGERADAITRQCIDAQLPRDQWPEFLLNRPEMDDRLGLFFDAFNSLSTCRAIGMDIGPIPFTATMLYLDEIGIADPSERMRFWRVIQAIDARYLDAIRDRSDREREASKSEREGSRRKRR